MYQASFDMNGMPFFGVIIGPYYRQQDVSSTLFCVFNLKDENKFQTKNAPRTVRTKPADRAR